MDNTAAVQAPPSTFSVIMASRPVIRPLQVSSGVVYIRSLSAAQHLVISRHNRDNEHSPFRELDLAAMALVEPDGRAVFANYQEGAEQLREAQQGDIAYIAKCVLKLSGIPVTGDEQEEAEKKS